MQDFSLLAVYYLETTKQTMFNLLIADYMQTRLSFFVLGTLTNNVDFNNLVMTAHWSQERVERHNKIMSLIGDGKLVASFEVDTKHPNGTEIHNVFDNGIVLIQNKQTQRLVTELIARPQQIKRYWEYLGKPMPIEVWVITSKAREHQLKGWNNW